MKANNVARRSSFIFEFTFLETDLRRSFCEQRPNNASFPFLSVSPLQIIPGGAASRTGKLRMGDRILSVNGSDIRSASHETAVMALISKAEQMNMKVQHDPLPKGFQVGKG